MARSEHVGGIDPEHLRGIVARIDSAKQRSDDARADLGNAYKHAEDININRAALKFSLKLRDMESDKRNDFVASAQIYCGILGVWSQGDLFDDAPRTSPASPAAAAAAGDGTGFQADAGSPNFQKGHEAARAGLGVDECPWAPGVRAYDSWMAGHAAGLRAIEDGLEEAPARAAPPATAAEEPPAASAAESKRRVGGRPKGSKNKPKPPAQPSLSDFEIEEEEEPTAAD
jgi:uncharacterized protein (UPF0335 family)